MIQKAIDSGIDEILEITKSCALYLIDNQVYLWDEYHSNKEVFIFQSEYPFIVMNLFVNIFTFTH